MTKISKNAENNKLEVEQKIPKPLKNQQLSYKEFHEKNTEILTEIELEWLTNGNIQIKHPTEIIFESLPKLLKEGIQTLKDQKDKEVFLYGALGCLSSIMPNVSGNYSGSTVYTNLYVYILGSAGAGKGKLEFARQLIIPVHSRMQEISEKKKGILLPANTTSTKFIKDLSENEGEGLFFETEGDTMANAFAQDTGNYSDTFRKGFHHEPVSLSRVENDLKIYITKPRISAVLSSTFGQLLTLIKNPEDGLFSRFLFHEIESIDEFLNPFDKSKRGYESVFEGLGNKVFDMHEDLKKFELIDFNLSSDQETMFLQIFTKWKIEMQSFVNNGKDYGKNDLDGTVHRLGLICFRVAMILTTIRNYETENLKPELICTDVDFHTAFRIVEIAKNNAMAIFTRLPKPRYIFSEKANKLHDKADQYDQVIQLYKEGVSLKKIALQVFQDENKKPVVQSWINKFKSGAV